MADSSPILTAGTFVSAFIGAFVGILVGRFWRRIEPRALFRIQLGEYQDRHGWGTMLTITNVGLDPIPEYSVRLFHPERGSLGVFSGDASELVFPQSPDQQNRFECLTRPRDTGSEDRDMSDTIKHWLLHLRDKQVAAPSFEDFRLRLVMRNSELVLFEDEDLGNCLAKHLYEDSIGQKVEQRVKEVFYHSRAPFWIEWIRRHRIRKMIKGAVRESPPET